MARKARKKWDGPMPDKDMVRAFFGWVRARHGAWYARYVLQRKPPWTDDQIVARYFFTNVYRELDPGTRYIRSVLPRAADQNQAVFWALAYRLAFHERSMGALLKEDLLYPSVMHENSPRIRAVLRSMEKPFTPAYVVSNYGRKGSKVDVITDILMGIADTMRGPEWPGTALQGREEFVGWCLAHAHGIGPFVGFQALVDLCYPGTGRQQQGEGAAVRLPWLPFSNDGWVVAGPGAIKGLRLLYDDEALATYDSNDLVRNLCRLQGALLHNMPGWSKGGRTRRINRSNMQNCCCEFSKYVRIMRGGRSRRKFDPTASRLRDREEQGMGQQLDMIT